MGGAYMCLEVQQLIRMRSTDTGKDAGVEEKEGAFSNFQLTTTRYLQRKEDKNVKVLENTGKVFPPTRKTNTTKFIKHIYSHCHVH
jgi:hypothetical protein